MTESTKHVNAGLKSPAELATKLFEGKELYTEAGNLMSWNSSLDGSGFEIVGKEGHTTSMYAEAWHNYTNVTEIIKPKWYENIPQQGVLCWVSDNDPLPNSSHASVVVLAYINDGDDDNYPFKAFQADYGYATPLTSEQIKELFLSSD